MELKQERKKAYDLLQYTCFNRIIQTARDIQAMSTLDYINSMSKALESSSSSSLSEPFIYCTVRGLETSLVIYMAYIREQHCMFSMYNVLSQKPNKDICQMTTTQREINYMFLLLMTVSNTQPTPDSDPTSPPPNTLSCQ